MDPNANVPGGVELAVRGKASARHRLFGFRRMNGKYLRWQKGRP